MSREHKPARPRRRFWRRRFWRRRYARPAGLTSRRGFLAAGAAMAAAGLGLLVRRMWPAIRPGQGDHPPIRPPTADRDDAVFRAACIGCGLCGTVCENGCIRFFGAGDTRWGALTPYLDLRQRSCTLCMRCTQICPTSALRAVPRELETIASTIDMGVAVVDPDRCLSFLGRICGYCHDACPFPSRAIKLAPPGKPIVIADGCVGCGRCVELCPQRPTAIDVVRRATGPREAS